LNVTALGRINLGSHPHGNRQCDVISTGIKLLGNRLVIGHHLIEIGQFVPNDALSCKCLPHLRTPQPHVLQGGDHLGEQQAPEVPITFALVAMPEAIGGLSYPDGPLGTLTLVRTFFGTNGPSPRSREERRLREEQESVWPSRRSM